MIADALFSLMLLLGIAADPPPSGPAIHRAQLEFNASELQHCLELQVYVRTMIDSTLAPPPFALALWADGKRMCEQGMVHGGISQLRMAAKVLRTSAMGPVVGVP